jgi:hypothetical protein
MRQRSREVLAAMTSVIVAVSCLPILAGCGFSELPEIAQARQEFEERKSDRERREAAIAVEIATASIGFVRGGGYQAVTAQSTAERLVALMNSPQAPAPGRRFTYGAGDVTGPWQVVVRAEGDTLTIAAYGKNTARPVEQRTIAVGRY